MATAAYVQKGESVDYTPSLAVDCGEVVVQGSLIGVAAKAIGANALGALVVEGVFDFPKTAGSGGETITAGAKLYWDTVNEVATATVGANVYIGKAVQDAGADDTTVRVRLDQ